MSEKVIVGRRTEKAGGGGVLYLDIPAWGNALSILVNEIGIPVVRAADTPIKKRYWYGEPGYEDGVHVYFENESGDEVGYWTAGMNILHVFAVPRKVHESMRTPRTLWEESTC